MTDESENAAALPSSQPPVPRRRLPIFWAEKCPFGGWHFGVSGLIGRVGTTLIWLYIGDLSSLIRASVLSGLSDCRVF